MTGLSIDALSELRDMASKLKPMQRTERSSAAIEMARIYLADARQEMARQSASKDEADGTARIFAFQAEWIIEEAPKLSDLGVKWLEILIMSARHDKAAYDAIQAVVATLVRQGEICPSLREFIADDYAGRVSPSLKTRQRSPREWMRQAQLGYAALALKNEGGMTENAACTSVAKAACLAFVDVPKASTYRATTTDHVRRALRMVRAEKLGGIES